MPTSPITQETSLKNRPALRWALLGIWGLVVLYTVDDTRLPDTRWSHSGVGRYQHCPFFNALPRRKIRPALDEIPRPFAGDHHAGNLSFPQHAFLVGKDESEWLLLFRDCLLVRDRARERVSPLLSFFHSRAETTTPMDLYRHDGTLPVVHHLSSFNVSRPRPDGIRTCGG